MKLLTRREALQKGGIVLGGTAFAGITAANQGGTVERTDLSGETFTNPCYGEQGEEITIDEGYLQTVTQGTSNNSYHVHLTLQGVRGTGLDSGQTYVLTGSSNTNFTARDPFPVIETAIVRNVYVTEGPTENVAFNFSTIVTVYSDGETKVEYQGVDSRCI